MKGIPPIEALRNIAISNGGKCLSVEYVNAHTNLRWQCAEGHKWKARPSHVTQGHWCPYCGGVKPLSLKEIKQIALGRGGNCLSKKYVNKYTKLLWRCSEGHEWEATPGSIKSGTWCPYCAKRVSLSIQEMQIIAMHRGGICLSEKYVNSQTKLHWRCIEGHEWEARPESVKRGSWCRICSSSMGERLCRVSFEKIFGSKFPAVKPSWLQNKEGNLLELDGYSSDLKLAFEYQGIQHYLRVAYFHPSKDDFQKRLRDDRLKEKLCKANGVTLIHIPELGYKLEPSKLIKFIVSECKRQGVRPPLSSKKVTVNLDQIYSSPRTKALLTKMNEIARKQGGNCLSEKYISSHIKLRWRCAKGHEWESNPMHIVKGRWCHICAGWIKGTIEEMHEIAQKRGGKCLSSKYRNAHYKLRWRCAKGHEWGASPDQIKREHWCPDCGRRKGTIDEMRTIAHQKGGDCLSGRFVNGQFKLRWRCDRGHEWKAIPDSLRAGSWCPQCNCKKRKTIGEMRQIAKARGGRCLSMIYVDRDTKLHWQCENGHQWYTKPKQILEGSWCPVCSRKCL